LIAWMQSNGLRFANWRAAIRELAGMIGGEPSAAFEAYVRETFVEIDGEIRERTAPEEMADQVLAIVDRDVLAPAKRVEIPTLLIASGQPAERRAPRERAWRRFADSSPLIELQVEDAWGHNPIWQDSAASAGAIADWLERHR
jgi:pimeloyl-ACP methyl ester carboxylesterase